jgi:hypothetical protein
MPALRALLGEALTEAEFVEIKRHYLVLWRAAGYVGEPVPREGQRRRSTEGEDERRRLSEEMAVCDSRR